MELLIVTGMSGAGKSTALQTLEEIGFYCMDNLPPTLLFKVIELFKASNVEKNKVAVVVDVRGGKFFDDLSQSLDLLEEKKVNYKILFLDASNTELIKRYKETRRTHPLTPVGGILNGLERERVLLNTVKNRADYILDTTKLSVKLLKFEIKRLFEEGEKKNKISILITSFGFKNGILLDGDLIFDVRFLPNPYYKKELKEISGKNKKTKEYIFKWPQTTEFLNKVTDLVEYLIPYYIKEGKSQLSIGIGCTGGFHRSVAITDTLGALLEKKDNVVIINHRDLNR